MRLDMGIVVQAIPAIGQGIGTTAAVSVSAFLIGIPVGLLMAGLSLSHSKPLRWSARSYSAVTRSTPFLVLVYLGYFGLPKLGLALQPWQVGVATLSLTASGYFCEISRAAITSVSMGQRQAGLALGLTRAQVNRHVVLPQALVLMTPATAGLMISLLKESSVLSVISLAEITFRSQLLTAATFAYSEVLVVTAAAYWILATGISTTGKVVERRLRRWNVHPG